MDFVRLYVPVLYPFEVYISGVDTVRLKPTNPHSNSSRIRVETVTCPRVVANRSGPRARSAQLLNWSRRSLDSY